MRLLLIVIGALSLLSSCGIDNSLMFRTKDAEVITDTVPIAPTEAYRLAPDDKFIFTISTNDGKRIIDGLTGISEGGLAGGSGNPNGATNSGFFNYWIKPTGSVQLPLLGEVFLAGKSVKEAQDYIGEMYAEFYTDPFVQLEVTNQRVIVFPGGAGSAKVVNLANNNTTLMEVLALAGGISERGQSKKIKIMRRTSEGRKVYQVDLSTMAGLKYADMIVQSNDYIYVEPTRQISREILQEIGPILSIISSSIVVISIINAFN